MDWWIDKRKRVWRGKRTGAFLVYSGLENTTLITWCAQKLQGWQFVFKSDQTECARWISEKSMRSSARIWGEWKALIGFKEKRRERAKARERETATERHKRFLSLSFSGCLFSFLPTNLRLGKSFFPPIGMWQLPWFAILFISQMKHS